MGRLKISASLQRILFPQQINEAQPHFFEHCITMMVHLGKYTEVIHLMNGMREEHDVEIRRELALELVKIMEDHRLRGMYEEDMLTFMEHLSGSVRRHQSNLFHHVKKNLNASLASAGVGEVHLSYINSMLDNMYRGKYSTTLDEESSRG